MLLGRGEIARRIIDTANELSLLTFALVTANDTSHAISASHRLDLPSPAAYLSVDTIVSLATENGIDAIHPGYGFLSESPVLARAATAAGILVVGPGEEALERTGDKLAARRLAEECQVPCLPAMTEPTGQIEILSAFARRSGYPIMLKAVDGGGGRGIRLVRDAQHLVSAARLAINESPSKQIFAERAAVDGFRHVEVQIVGDGSGRVAHLFERECSIQRRYQKIVELAPSTLRQSNPALVDRIIQSAVHMAETISYRSLGTFEFLANPHTHDFFFLEVNPRLQVEHTITEQINGGMDIVRAQLLIAQGVPLADALGQPVPPQPPSHSIQLRITAENPQLDWRLSVGKITSFTLPMGNGIRVDTALTPAQATTVTADFDSLVAKIIVTAPGWQACVAKAVRALADISIEGIQTNLSVLRAIVAHSDFAVARSCDTQWLEREGRLPALVSDGMKLTEQIQASAASRKQDHDESSGAALSGSTSSAVLLRKGDAWKVDVHAPQGGEKQQHHLKLERILRNELPLSLAALLTYATPSDPRPAPLQVTLTSTSASAGAIAGTTQQRRGDASNPAHVLIPFAGKLVEVLVEEGEHVEANGVICIVQQMKMELEVRSARAGQVKWLLDLDEGDDVGEGVLACELDLDGERKARL